MAYSMTDDEFESCVSDALENIPRQLLDMMDNVAVFIEDRYQPQPGEDPSTSLLGLYDGVPLTERDDGWGAGALPDRITIFQEDTLAACSSREEVIAEVQITVVHEIAHHFGIDDETLHRLGWC
ncbi:metallopeptidase family protein [Arthrobacter sp.]|uniref:metallopeptidase family protein n=1 Tax=Arthrobacter sp. TaxID=1667 RepID=UPI003A95853C